MDFVSELGSPVAYYPELNAITGSVNATILMMQLVRLGDKDGWVNESREVLKNETGLSRFEQEGAKKLLKQCEILIEQFSGWPRRQFQKIDIERVKTLWNQHKAENQPLCRRKTSLQEEENQPAVISKGKNDHHPKKKITTPPKQETELPEPFELTDSNKQWIHEQEFHFDKYLAHDEFLDHYRKTGIKWKDWQAAWRSWMRKAEKFYLRDNPRILNGTVTQGNPSGFVH